MHYSNPADFPSSKAAPWFHLFVLAFAITAWLTVSLRATEARLSRTADLLARTESRLEKSRTEVRDLKKSVDEVKKMVGTLAKDIDGSLGDDEEDYADEGDDGPYLANRAGKPAAGYSRPVPL
jgi:hypothetical protein